MNPRPTALLLLALAFAVHATAQETHRGDAHVADVSPQAAPVPPYDVFRHAPSSLYPVSQLDLKQQLDARIDFGRLPRRKDGLPYVVRLMWGTCVTPGKNPPSFSCIWSDGTVTHTMPRTQVPPVQYTAADPEAYQLRYILKPETKDGG